MNFINITNATGSSGNKKYISQYKINDKQNRLIGYSKLSLDVEANYLLEIIIVNKRYEFYHEILRQNLYKFINLVNKNGAKLNVIIPANVNASRIIKKALHLEEFQPARNNSNSADKYQYTLNISNLLGANNYKSVSNANTRIGKARTRKQALAHDTTKSKKTKKIDWQLIEIIKEAPVEKIIVQSDNSMKDKFDALQSVIVTCNDMIDWIWITVSIN